jgi:hypothetical protein
MKKHKATCALNPKNKGCGSCQTGSGKQSENDGHYYLKGELCPIDPELFCWGKRFFCSEHVEKKPEYDRSRPDRTQVEYICQYCKDSKSDSLVMTEEHERECQYNHKMKSCHTCIMGEAFSTGWISYSYQPKKGCPIYKHTNGNHRSMCGSWKGCSSAALKQRVYREGR